MRYTNLLAFRILVFNLATYNKAYARAKKIRTQAFEEEFGCEIPDDAAEKILTVKDAIDFISDSA